MNIYEYWKTEWGQIAFEPAPAEMATPRWIAGMANNLGDIERTLKRILKGSAFIITERPSDSLANVKEHATLSVGASVDHGVEVETTGEHEKKGV